jgi:hypothetical protein
VGPSSIIYMFSTCLEDEEMKLPKLESVSTSVPAGRSFDAIQFFILRRQGDRNRMRFLSPLPPHLCRTEYNIIRHQAEQGCKARGCTWFRFLLRLFSLRIMGGCKILLLDTPVTFLTGGLPLTGSSGGASLLREYLLADFVA